MKPSEPEYLGDGVYASFDGYHIWLRTGSHRDHEATNKIALEPAVFAALLRYHAREVNAAAASEGKPSRGGDGDRNG